MIVKSSQVEQSIRRARKAAQFASFSYFLTRRRRVSQEKLLSSKQAAQEKDGEGNCDAPLVIQSIRCRFSLNLTAITFAPEKNSPSTSCQTTRIGKGSRLP